MNNAYRNFAVFVEIGSAIKYLKNALAEIQKISDANDFYDPLLIFLSGGLERLFKSMICLNFKKINNRFPNYEELRDGHNGHDIEFLKKKVEAFCVPVDNPFAANDYRIITEDDLINSICRITSVYGQKGRYFNLDAILGVDQKFDAKERWEKIESEVAKEYFGEEYTKMLLDPKLLPEVYQKSNDSKTFIFEIEEFSDIDDCELGKTDYRIFQNHERVKRR